MTSNPNEHSSNSIEQSSELSVIRPEPVFSVLNTPDPPAPWKELAFSVKEQVLPRGKKSSSLLHFTISGLRGLFPVLGWGRNYDLNSFRSDIMAGLTLASLGIPQVNTNFLLILLCFVLVSQKLLNAMQSIGYANLAKLEPQYGLCK